MPKSKNRYTIAVAVWYVFFCVLFTCTSVTAQCVLVCNNDVQIALNNNGIAQVTPALILENIPNCSTNLDVQIVDQNGQNIGNVLTCDQVNQVVTAHIVDLTTGNSCSTNITVLDNLPPTINCIDQFIYCNQPADPQTIGYPQVYDNCTNLTATDLSYFDNITPLDCNESMNGRSVAAKIERTWLAMDASGWTSSCVQHIYFENIPASMVIFPEDRVGVSAYSCEEFTNLGDLPVEDLYAFNEIINNDTWCQWTIFYSDQTFPTCGEAMLVYRDWELINWCSGVTHTHTQLLDFADQTPPTIQCISDTIIAVNTYECTATVELPVPVVSDNCSEFTVTPYWEFGYGFEPFEHVPLGTYPVEYTATDLCGNTATCIIYIEIIDLTPPQVFCDNILNISVLQDGTAAIPASVLDENSRDNCSISSIQASRDGINFSDMIFFDCTDIENSPIRVQLKVTDHKGFSNSCQTDVFVYDYLAPLITCPADITVQCQQNYTDLSQTGIATASDNCSLDTLSHEDIVLLDEDCGTGIIYRQWQAKDESENIKACTQVIHIENNELLDVQFPSDQTIDLCQMTTDVALTGSPQIVGDFCKNIGITHSDALFEIDGNCSKIARSWIVVDWCVYVANSGINNGRYEHTQWITIEDSTPPVLQCLAETTIYNEANDCSAVFMNIPTVQVIDCDPNITIQHDSEFADQMGSNASGFYPIGEHVITFTATDFCGNMGTCSYTLHVLDRQAPNIICAQNKSIDLDHSGTIIIDPNWIDDGSFDNCSNILSKSVQPNQFSCLDTGYQNITLYISDEFNNIDSCQTTIYINDPSNACTTPTAQIEGQTMTEKGKAIKDVKIELRGDMILENWTDTAGLFTMDDIPMYDTYSLTPFKDGDDIDGISTFDLVLMQQHILGIHLLDSPYKLIAADVNNSGTITTFDVIITRQLILNIIQDYPQSPAWRFVASDHIFPNPNNPFSFPFPEVFVLENLDTNIQNLDFIAIKMGDVNGSW